MRGIMIFVLLFGFAGNAFGEENSFDFDIFNIPRYQLTKEQYSILSKLAAQDTKNAEIAFKLATFKIKENNLYIKRVCLLYLKALESMEGIKDIKKMRVQLLGMSVFEIMAQRNVSIFTNLEKTLESSDIETVLGIFKIYKMYLTSYLEAYYSGVDKVGTK